MIFGINTSSDILKLSQISITYNNFEISLVVFMPNITTNHAITYTNQFSRASLRYSRAGGLKVRISIDLFGTGDMKLKLAPSKKIIKWITKWRNPAVSFFVGTLKSDDGNKNVKKAKGLITKTTIFTCITLFCTFVCRHCTTKMWKCLISRFTEEVHKQRRNFLSLTEVGYGS